MLEVSESKLSQYSIHHVSENIMLGEEAYKQPEVMLEAAFTQLAFHKIDTEQTFEFFHESDIGLNEVYTFAKSIFDQPTDFLQQSQHIAKHLHSVSQHPNIKPGELFIGLFENCLWVDDVCRVLSIVKIEDKEIFLDVKNEQDQMTVQGIDGVNVKKIYNMAVIIDRGADEAPIVLIKTKKKEDVVYWQEQFLKLRVADVAFYKTNLAMTACKKYILKEDQYSNTEKLGLLNKTLDYFRQEEDFIVDDYLEKVFDVAEEGSKDVLVQTIKPFETVISESAIAKAEKTYRRKIKLDDHVEIQVNVRDAKQIEQIIEVGFDEVTRRKYYKIYFDEEV